MSILTAMLGSSHPTFCYNMNTVPTNQTLERSTHHNESEKIDTIAIYVIKCWSLYSLQLFWHQHQTLNCQRGCKKNQLHPPSFQLYISEDLDPSENWEGMASDLKIWSINRMRERGKCLKKPTSSHNPEGKVLESIDINLNPDRVSSTSQD